MLAFLKGMGEYIGGTIAGKVIVIAVASATVATGTGVVIHNSVQTQDKPKAAAMVMEVSSNMSSSNIIDSQVSSGTNTPTSSATTSTIDPNSAVSAINKAADDGVSKVQEAANSAVSQVQAAASTVQTSPVSVPKVTIEKQTISWAATNSGMGDGGSITLIQGEVDTQNHKFSINYGGYFGKQPDVQIKNSAGIVVGTSGKNYIIVIPYTNISDISTLYFCVKDQQVKITVTQ